MSGSYSESNKGIRIAFIGSYPDLAQKLKAMAETMNVSLAVYYAKYEDAARRAKTIANAVDVIISRGVTSDFIRNAVDLPVINIPVGPFDLVLALRLMEAIPDRIAFMNYDRMFYGIETIESIYNVQIDKYIVHNQEEVMLALRKIAASGVKTFIGGNASVTASVTNNMGLHGIEISAGNESVYNALHEAVQVVMVNREEKKRNQWLNTTMNSLVEGIVVEGKDGRIIMHNDSAKRLLRMKNLDPNGMQITDVVSEDILTRKSTERIGKSYIRGIGTSNIACSTFSVKRDGEHIATVRTFEDVTRIQNLEHQVRAELHAKGFIARHNFDDIITCSEEMKESIIMSKLFAQTDSAVMIFGESGTGKEMFAQSIHNFSSRKHGPFVAINCAALPESLLESELFGYESGAFSGARKEGRAGLFEMAHHGTIFLDEIGELPISFQSKLLRAIQEKEILRVGGSKVIPVDIRIISATNRNLSERMEKGEFRQDLYYRLNVLNVTIPPLRKRKADIQLLFEGYLKSRMEMNDKQRARMNEIIQSLNQYNWPGNIRELFNVAERSRLYLQNMEYELVSEKMILQLEAKDTLNGDGPITVSVDISKGLKEARDQAERQIIEYAYKQCGGNKDEMSKLLNVGRSTLWRKENEGQ